MGDCNEFWGQVFDIPKDEREWRGGGDPLNVVGVFLPTSAF